MLEDTRGIDNFYQVCDRNDYSKLVKDSMQYEVKEKWLGDCLEKELEEITINFNVFSHDIPTSTTVTIEKGRELTHSEKVDIVYNSYEYQKATSDLGINASADNIYTNGG